ncbi:hypothetical protein BB560_001854 [Smittium megazygosporum]|uniref:Transcription elongation factor n=1 Tax=Smittium megazygosporum TaxID=133381 RepID=A0A2T9ZGD3_9FUNG|nr:hypothetical protein BB560_001854 [Smittium megazygosporum]
MKSEIETVSELKKSLLKAYDDEKQEIVLDILSQLSKVTATEDLLKKSGIGMTVGKLRNDKNPDISKLAKSVVHKWKKNVTEAAASAKRKPETPKVPAEPHKIKTPQPDQKLPSPVVSESKPKIDQTEPKKAHSPANSTSRNFASDNVKLNSTGDKVRDKCTEMLYNSLCVDNNTDSNKLLKKAVEIELEEYKKQNGVTPAYKAEIRSFFLNLKDSKNPNLRYSVINGTTSAADFVKMSPEDMASEERKRQDSLIRKDNLFKAQGAGPQEAETDMFRCGKCGSRKCRYYQMQTRSADEPMTTFVTCTNCNNRWKFC